jgi:hypothetical protein
LQVKTFWSDEAIIRPRNRRVDPAAINDARIQGEREGCARPIAPHESDQEDRAVL